MGRLQIHLLRASEGAVPEVPPHLAGVGAHRRMSLGVAFEICRVLPNPSGHMREQVAGDFQRLLLREAARELQKAHLVGEAEAVVLTPTAGNARPVLRGEADALGDQWFRERVGRRGHRGLCYSGREASSAAKYTKPTA